MKRTWAVSLCSDGGRSEGRGGKAGDLSLSFSPRGPHLPSVGIPGIGADDDVPFASGKDLMKAAGRLQRASTVVDAVRTNAVQEIAIGGAPVDEKALQPAPTRSRPL